MDDAGSAASTCVKLLLLAHYAATGPVPPSSGTSPDPVLRLYPVMVISAVGRALSGVRPRPVVDNHSFSPIVN